ncbi:MAG TPA: carboxypeptidase regulatory-like domain-containing protein [Acidimicrobiales bacterium]|nr:carboxypeptidase regulatory-like domain-containing protein [Acidimicrobiales bacterium]
MAAGDLGGNGDDDVLWQCGDDLDVALGNGDGTFQQPAAYPEDLSGQNTHLLLADLEGSGNLDAVAYGESGPDGTGLEVWHGNGDGSFAAGEEYSVGNQIFAGVVEAAALTTPGTDDLVAFDKQAGGDLITIMLASGGRPSLEASDVSAPSGSPAPGQIVAGSYTVTDTGSAVSETWTDSVYLASGAGGSSWSSADTVLERISQTETLSAGGSYSGQYSFPMPDVAPGTYHLIVVPDSGDVLSGADETPAASPPFDVGAIPTLTVGASALTTTIEQGDPLYYQLDVTAASDVEVTLSELADVGDVTLLVGQGQVPTASSATYASVSGSIDLPSSDPGTWYLVLQPNAALAATPVQVGVAASALSGLSVSAISPAGNDIIAQQPVSVAAGFGAGSSPPSPPPPPSGDGLDTITLRGTGFGPDLSVEMVDGTETYPAVSVTRSSSTLAFASFRVESSCVGVSDDACIPTEGVGPDELQPGTYDVEVSSGGHSVTLPQAYRLGIDLFDSATDGDPPLSVEVSAPSELREGWTGELSITLDNNTDTDLAVPVVDVTSSDGTALLGAPGVTDPSDFSSSVELDMPVFSSDPALDPSPPGILAGGARATLEVGILSGTTTAHAALDTTTTVLDDTDPTPIDWSSLLADYQPPGMSDADWQDVVEHFAGTFGDTDGAFALSLEQAFSDASSYGVTLSSESDAIGYLVDEELASDPDASVTGTLELGSASDPVGDVTLSLTSTTDGSVYTTTSFYDGDFAFFDVPAGTYDLAAAGYLPATLQSVDVSPTAQGLDVVAEAGATLTGTITDQGGSNPVSGAVVTATDAAGTLSSAPTGPGGAYTIGGLEAGDVTVTASAPGYEPDDELSATVADAAPTTLDVSLEQDGSISGTLSAPGGGPPSGASVDAELTSGGSILSGTVDADGTYSITGLAPGTYSVVAEAPGDGPAESSVSVTAGSDSSGTDLALSSSPSSISGTVTDADSGAPVAGAIVSTDALNGAAGPVVTAADGSYTLSGLPAGSIDLVVVPPDTTHLAATEQVTTSAGQTATENVALEPAGTLEATIVASDGATPLSGVEVEIVGPSPLTSESPEQSQPETTDSSGEISLGDLPEGGYDLQVVGSDAHEDFSIGPNARLASLTLTVPTGTLSGEVEDSNGEPLSGVTVALSDASGLIDSTETDASGDYSFTVTSAGDYDVVASGPSAGVLVANSVAVSLGGTTTVPPLQAGTASLSVSVTSGGDPVTGASVELSTGSADDQPALDSASTDATGTAVLDDLAPGSYELEVADGSDATYSGTVSVAAGSNTDSIALETPGTIAGTVTDSSSGPIAGADVVATGSASGLVFATTTGTGGAYSLSDLPADTYSVSVSAPGEAPSLQSGVSVSSGGETSLDPTLETSGATLTLSLAANGNGPIPPLSAMLEDSSGAPVDSEQIGGAVSASDGTDSATFSPLGEGSYTLVVSGPGRATTTQAVDITGSNATAAITVPAGDVLPLAATTTDATAQLHDASASATTTTTAPSAAGTTTTTTAPSATTTTTAPSAAGTAAAQLRSDSAARAAGGVSALLHGLAGSSSSPSYWSAIQYFFKTWPGLLANPSASSSGLSAAQTYQSALDEYQDLVPAKCYNPYQAKALAYLQAAYQALQRWQGDFNYLQNESLTQRLTIAGDAASAVGSVAELAAAALAAAPAAAAAAGALGISLGAEVTAALATLSAAQIVNQAQLGFGSLTPTGVVGQINDAGGIVTSAFENLLEEGSKGAIAAKWLGQLSNFVNVYTSVKGALDDAVTAMSQISNTVADGKAAQGNFNNFLGYFQKALDEAVSYRCPPNPPTSPPPPVPTPVLEYPYPKPQNIKPNDPNAIYGPTGDGTAAQYVQPGATMPYTVLFQNDGSAPATEVLVTISLPPGLDPSSVQLTGFGFGQSSIPLADAGTSFSDLLSGLDLANGDEVSASGSFDASTNTITWAIEAINPATGDVDGTPSGGFLPPDDTAGDGEGYVSFQAEADPALTTGTTVDVRASVIFDKNAPIVTNLWSNTIDGTPPSATVVALPTSERGPFAVSWSGTTPGAPITTYQVYVSDDGGAYALWQSASAPGSATYPGVAGHSYNFVALAGDDLGNVQPFPTSAQAGTVVSGAPAPLPGSSGSAGTTTTTTTAVPTTSRSSSAASRPRVSWLSRTAGPRRGGTVVLIVGNGFAGATQVSFGKHRARFEVISGEEIRAVSPPGTGTAVVSVISAAGTSPASRATRFSYLGRAVVLGLLPSAGPAAGRTVVTIRGSWFDDVSAVRFGTRSARFRVLSAGEIRAVAPSGAGTVAVRVTTAAGTSATRASDRFHYRSSKP